MKEHQTELAAEFNKYCPEIDFKPVCKHIKWYEKQLLLYTDIQLVNNRYPSNHPRVCVYQYDYRRRKILYKITDNRYSPNMEWTPQDTWQEKDVYDSSSMPTGNCWEVLEGALSQPVPYKIHHYSSSIEAIMNKTYYPKKH
jgi:hypothetical protein